MASLELVKILLQAMKVSERTEASFESLLPIMSQQFLPLNGIENGSKGASLVVNILKKVLKQGMPSYIAEQEQFYVDHYTDEEIIILIDWYNSEGGRRVIEKQNSLMPELQMMNMRWVQNLAKLAYPLLEQSNLTEDDLKTKVGLA